MVPTVSEIYNPEPVFWVENECVWVKNDFFSMVGGDFYKDIYAPKLFGMHSGSVLNGSDAGNANTDLKMSILTICRVGNVHVHRAKRSFLRCLEVLEGTFVRTYMRQSCLGCMVEGFL